MNKQMREDIETIIDMLIGFGSADATWREPAERLREALNQSRDNLNRFGNRKYEYSVRCLI